ncbi:MAG: 50S ribosomal protein L10, partial [Candidatus Nanohaloarchaea archaeon]
MQMTRQEKEDLVEDLAGKIDDHPVVGILDMHSLPARQLQDIKKELVGDVEIRMTRKTLIERALDAAETDGVDALADNDAVMPALLFSDGNPFSLFQLIQEKKSSAPASGGEIAPTDIEVPDGKTGLDPGPMLGRLQSLGAETSVEDGEIAVADPVIAVEAGETIDADTAEILNNLGIEPLEVGLDLKLAFADGEVFDRDVLEIDTDEYRADVETAASQAFALAVNAGVMNDATAETVI